MEKEKTVCGQPNLESEIMQGYRRMDKAELPAM